MSSNKKRETLYFYLFILGLSILPTIPFFITSNLLHTHDGLVHLPRLAAFYTALSDGHFPVRWAGYLNYGYGMPLFNFIYQLPYYIGSIFLLIGVELVNAFKLSLMLSFLLSAIFMFAFAKEYFKDSYKALLVTALYQFTPFRMIELLVRGSYGEVYTYALFPLVLFSLTKYSEKKNSKFFILTATSTALLIISHNSVSLLFFGAIGLFVLFTQKGLKNIALSLFAMGVGLGIAAFYWIPALFEHRYTYGNLYMKNLYLDHFVPVWKFFAPNFANSKSLQTEGITTYIGVFQSIALVATAWILIRKKKIESSVKRILYYSLAVFIFAFFFMLPVSKPIWQAPFSDFLRQFQFPWRFLSLVTVATSFLAVSIPEVSIKLQNKRVYIFVCLAAVLCVAFYWKASEGYQRIDEKYYWSFPLNTTYYGETDVIWSAGPAKAYPKNRVDIIGGKGIVQEFVRTNSQQEMKVTGDNDLQLVSHTQYFPGWRAFVDGSEVPIEFQDPNNRGELTFHVPKGEHMVNLKFGESKIRVLADVLSIFSLLLIFPISILVRKIFK